MLFFPLFVLEYNTKYKAIIGLLDTGVLRITYKRNINIKKKRKKIYI